MVGSVGVFILTAVGGGPVDIATVIVMVIAMDTDAVPGPATEQDIGRVSEIPLEMYTVTGLPVFKREM
jgi:hypothetical protein